MRDIDTTRGPTPRDPAWTGRDEEAITCTPGVCGGKPCIAGTGLMVRRIHDARWLCTGTEDEIVATLADDYHVTPEQIRAALHYTGDIRDEEEVALDEAEATREASRGALCREAHRLAYAAVNIGHLDPVIERRACLAVALALLLCTLLALSTAPAAAQSTCPRRSDTLVLAMLTVHEAGWEAYDDLRGIHAALRNIAARDGISFGRAACLHSGRALRGETSRAWVSELDERGTAPPSWPRTVNECDESGCEVRPHPAWSNFRDRWIALLSQAAHVIGHADATFIDCSPMTWGSASDCERGEARGRRVFLEVDCGETRNRFGSWVEVDRD